MIQAFKETEQPFSNLDISLANQRSNDNLVIGFTTRQNLKNCCKKKELRINFSMQLEAFTKLFTITAENGYP